MSRFHTGAPAPTGREVALAIPRRIILPAAVLWVAVVGVGLLLANVPENGINEWFVGVRTPTLDSVTGVISAMASTTIMTATCVVVVALVWWRSGRWWFAIVPAIALAVEAAVFLTSSLVVGRDRPDVDQLDDAPPTSSFPSGHTGASTSVYIAFALMATRIRNGAARVTVIVICVLLPIGVALARVYRGMHHPTDVLAGLAVGVTCALIAWNWLPEREAARAVVEEPAPAEPTSQRA